jgi:hypothetical protein
VAINGEDYELLFIAMEDFEKLKETLISPSLVI